MKHPSSTTFPPPDDLDSGSVSRCDIVLLAGSSVTLWAPPKTDVTMRTPVGAGPDTCAELALGLAPGRLVVVGRATPDCPVPYLDPAYRATPMLPDTQQSVLHGNDPADIFVSRAHFTLRSGADGAVVFTNGVPRVGGGIRPPMNGTKLMAPAVRYLEPGEEVLIPFGEAIAIRLPNRCVLQLKAN
jgi:hypothetical protein